MINHDGRLSGDLLVECAEWVWEQLQEDGYYMSGELVELILETERELGIHARGLPQIAGILEEEFTRRGIGSAPAVIDAALIGQVLSWEDEFLSLAGIRREES